MTSIFNFFPINRLIKRFG